MNEVREEVSIMARRKTHEEYVEQLAEAAPHIQVKESYQGNRVPIGHYCTKHDIEWDVSPFNILQKPTGCKECVNEVMKIYYDGRRKSDEQFRSEVGALGTGIIPRGKYTGSRDKMSFECKNGHIWSSTPHDVLDGYGCPFCSGNAVMKGYNDLWTTHPDIAKMLKDPNVGYEISKGSHREVEWMCPNCGMVKVASPKQVMVCGLACARCSDGISYPNRFITAMLSQVNVEYFKPEWSPEWADKYRYDAYFRYQGAEYLVEMDGGIGHGGIDFSTNEQDVVGLERDKIKNQLAQEHNIPLIRIDCRYELQSVTSRFDYIKNSILNSKLSEILDLTKINWSQCNADATKSLHMIAAKQYDAGMGIKEISEMLQVNYSTVYDWLKRMASEGLCTYVPLIGAASHQKNRQIVKTG